MQLKRAFSHRVLAFFLAVFMVVGMVPVGVFATTGTITITASSATLEKGGTSTLKATLQNITEQSGTTGTWSWSSDDTSGVLSFTSADSDTLTVTAGEVTSKTEVEMTASYEYTDTSNAKQTVTGTVKVTVNPTVTTTLDSVSVSATSTTLGIGVSTAVKASLTFSDSTTPTGTTYKWYVNNTEDTSKTTDSFSYSNETIGDYTFKVEATYDSVTKSDTVTITVVAPSFTTTVSDQTVDVGGSKSITAPTVSNEPNTKGALTYSSDETSIVTVDSASGKITGVSAGTATITATYSYNSNASSVKTTFKVTVNPVAVTPVIGAMSNVTMTAGGEQYVTASVTPTGDGITYSSDDETVVTIGKYTGKMEAISAGTATVTVNYTSSDNVSAVPVTFTVTVKAKDPVLSTKDSTDITLTLGTNVSKGVSVSVENPVDGRSVTWKSSSSNLVTHASGDSVTMVAQGNSGFTATVTASYTGAESIVFNVTVLSDSDSNVGGESSGDTEGDSGDTEDATPVEFEYTMNWYGEQGDIVLASEGKTAQRKVSVVVSLKDGYATSGEITAETNRVEALVVWEPIGSADNVVGVTQISYGQQYTYLNAGQVYYRVYIDLDGDGVLDSNEEENCFTFSVTNTGLVVSNNAVSLSTYATSETIYVYSYGDVGTIIASSQNTSIATVSTTTGSTANNEALQVVISSKDAVGTTYVLLEYSGGSEAISVSVADSVAGIIYPEQVVNVNSPLWFKDILSLIDDEAKKVYAGESLVRMQSIEVSTDEGIIYIGYQDSEYTGGAIGTSVAYYVNGYPSLYEMVFVPKASYTGSTAIITYTGYTSSDRSFYGEIHVTLGENRDITITTSAQTPISLTASDFSNMAQTVMSQNLSNVVFTIPEENDAVMYYEYSSADNYHHKLTHGEVITLANIDKVTIIPSPGFGTPAQDTVNNLSYLEIPYIATGSNGTVINQVLVLQVRPYEDHGPVVYNTRMGEYISLISNDFHENSRNNSKNDLFIGYEMSYITFTLPDASKGVLYEDYRSEFDYRAEVTAGTPYYATPRDPQISQVSFVPAKNFTGVVNIDFVGYNTSGGSYAGVLQINVTSQVAQDINYICTSGGYVSFNEEDFNQFARSTVGNNVDYITFTGIPDEYQGTLRLGQNPTYDGIFAEKGIKYYRTSVPYMSNLSFQSVAGYTGVAEIPFEGLSTTGQAFAGTISITITNQNVVQIPYSATRFSPAELTTIDFEHYAQERTSSSLDYVRFSLPDSDFGTLYYDYTASDDYHIPVSADNNYYASKEYYLSKISFVPNSDFVGTGYVDFTGFGSNGQQFIGRLMILVAESGDPLHYQIHSGEYLYLSSSAINSFCKETTGSTLNYITLELPSSRQGVLYQNYLATNTVHTGVSTSTRYYMSKENYINDIAFVSNDQYIGTVELNFTAVAEDGSTCSGILTIVVLPMEAEGTIYYYTSFSPIVFKTADISSMWNDATIDYIQLHNLPASGAGKLYYENNLTSFATLEDRYYGYNPERGKSIDTMIFVPAAAYTGTVTLAYTATTLAGTEFTGEIQIIITPQQVSQYFTDLKNHTWAISSADYLYTTGVTVGVGDGQFAPDWSISRGDYALMIQKAFRFSDVAGSNFSDVSANDYYANAVHTLRYYGIVSGDENNNFQPKDSISRQDAMIILHAAMVQAKKDLPTEDVNVLYNYADVTTVYTYAASQLSVMVKAGVVSGDSAGKLNPQAIMTRAEMAVVMHKAMTF